MVSDRREALARALSGGFDLVVVALRDSESIGVCQELRRRGFAGAVILLLASPHPDERILGLRLGADDALTSPFEVIELVARIEACVRRGHALTAADRTCASETSRWTCAPAGCRGLARRCTCPHASSS